MKKWIYSIGCLICMACGRQDVRVEGIPFRGIDDTRWGIVGQAGEVVCQNVFPGQPTVVTEGRFATPDTAGRWQLFAREESIHPVTEKRYAAIGYFHDGVAFAQRAKGEPLLLLDRTGKEVAVLDTYLGNAILMAHDFREGLALVYTANGKYGYIDTRGEMAIAPVFDYAGDFSEGRALVGVANEAGDMAYRVIDREGDTRFRVALQDCRLQERFSDGYLLFYNEQQGTHGALNRRGKVAVYFPAQVEEVTPFREGAAIYWSGGKAGLINKQGETLIPSVYEDGKMMTKNRVALKANGKWGLFDYSGRPVSALAYDGFQGEGEWLTGERDSLFVLIDEHGQEVPGKGFARVGSDFWTERECPRIFSVHEAVTPPPAEETKPKPATKKPHPQPRIEEARIDENNPFYREAKRVWSGKLEEKDADNRRMILNYMEHFRMSYVTKDIDFLRQLFSEDALIIVGNVVQTAPESGHRYLSSEKVRYSVRSKQEYLSRLQEIFDNNKQIDVKFTDFTIRRHPTREGIYGVSAKQGYTSDLYSDEGYLFLLWDFRDETAPKIHVRTWQPRMLDEQTPLPEQEIFNISSFNLE